MSGQRATNASRYAALAEHVEGIIARRQDPRPWIEANLWVRTKTQEIKPLLFNAAQIDYYQHRTRRDVILKPRQLGFTTEVCALFFADCLLRPHTCSVLVAHDLDSTEQIFRIIQLYWERLPEEEKARAGKPRYENRREFFWPRINSQFYVGTAGSLAFGRGQTINNLHCSEFAFWPKPEESLIALAQAVPAGGRIVIESTANGRGGRFHQLWQETQQGRTQFAGHYYVWFESAEYAELVTPEE